MYTLYGKTGSGSAAIEAALTLTRQPFRIVETATWEQNDAYAELLAVNPLGQIPTLVLDDGTALSESAAILIHLGTVHERYVRDRGTPPSIATFRLGAPARATAHLHAVLRERLARVTLPAPVEAIVLTSDETAPLAGRNLGFLPEDEANAVVVPLVDRLRSRLGDDVVTVLAAQPEHRPEYATSETAPDVRRRSPRSGARPARRTQDGTRTASVLLKRADVASADAPRPLWLLDEAKILSGALEAAPWILRDGPERIESGWWDGRDLRRDYFVAETPHGGIMKKLSASVYSCAHFHIGSLDPS